MCASPNLQSHPQHAKLTPQVMRKFMLPVLPEPMLYQRPCDNQVTMDFPVPANSRNSLSVAEMLSKWPRTLSPPTSRTPLGTAIGIAPSALGTLPLQRRRALPQVLANAQHKQPMPPHPASYSGAGGSARAVRAAQERQASHPGEQHDCIGSVILLWRNALTLILSHPGKAPCRMKSWGRRRLGRAPRHGQQRDALAVLLGRADDAVAALHDAPTRCLQVRVQLRSQNVCAS